MNQETEKWMARARTPETWARIRRLALLKRVFFVVAVVGVCMFVLMLAAGLFLTVFGDDPWWTGLVAPGVLLASIIPWCVTSFRLDVARYADGKESVGIVIEVVADEHHAPETQPSYDITITAELPGGGLIHRAIRMSEKAEPRPGQRIRFRHNTRDSDDLKDILFIEFVDEVVRQRDRGQP